MLYYYKASALAITQPTYSLLQTDMKYMKGKWVKLLHVTCWVTQDQITLNFIMQLQYNEGNSSSLKM